MAARRRGCRREAIARRPRSLTPRPLAGIAPDLGTPRSTASAASATAWHRRGRRTQPNTRASGGSDLKVRCPVRGPPPALTIVLPPRHAAQPRRRPRGLASVNAGIRLTCPWSKTAASYVDQSERCARRVPRLRSAHQAASDNSRAPRVGPSTSRGPTGSSSAAHPKSRPVTSRPDASGTRAGPGTAASTSERHAATEQTPCRTRRSRRHARAAHAPPRIGHAAPPGTAPPTRGSPHATPGRSSTHTSDTTDATRTTSPDSAGTTPHQASADNANTTATRR